MAVKSFINVFLNNLIIGEKTNLFWLIFSQKIIGELMAEMTDAQKRNFVNVYVCQTCNATMRCGSGKPKKCRKCNGSRFRPKKKKRKSV